MPGIGSIDTVYDAGKGSGLSAPGSAGYQDHTTGFVRKRHNLGRNAQFLPIGDREHYHPDHRRPRTPLPVDTGAETGKSRHSKGKIVIACSKKTGHFPLGKGIDLLYKMFALLRQQPLGFHRKQLAIQLIADRTAGNKKHIRSTILGSLG